MIWLASACQSKLHNVGIGNHTTVLCRRLGLPHLRYDSVKATHPFGHTPIYITYNEARGYPKYLVTYSS